jgi:hypothetical protein
VICLLIWIQIFAGSFFFAQTTRGFVERNFWKTPEVTRQQLHLTLPKSDQLMTASEIVYTQTPSLVLKEQKIPREKCPNPLLTAIA